MSIARISPYDGLDAGGFRRGAQCFGGACSQARVDAAASAAWPATPPFVAADPTAYAAVSLAQAGLLYAGPSTDPALWEVRAGAFPAGWWPVALNTGDVVVVRDL